MSNPGSPTGAQGNGLGPMENMLGQILVGLQRSSQQNAQEANRRMELLEQATARQLKEMTDTLSSLQKKPGIVDVKGIGKPEALKGSHEEARKMWKSWSYKFESWFGSQWKAGHAALDWARSKGDETITSQLLLDSTLEDVDGIDAHLHVALISLTQGMPYDIVFNSRKKCGLDAWRRLCHFYEPMNSRSNIRLLRRILNQPRVTMGEVRSAIDKWESDIVEYKDRGQPEPSDETKRAVLLAMVPENLEEHLELNVQRLDTYEKMRAEVVSYTEQKSSKAEVDHGGAMPMDLSVAKGSGKSAERFQGNCHICGKPGHKAAQCWSKGKSKDGKGSSKGKTSSKGDKGGKGKGKGKKGGGKKGKYHSAEGEAEPEGEWQGEEDGEWPTTEGYDDSEEVGKAGTMCGAKGSGKVRAESERTSAGSAQSSDRAPGTRLRPRENLQALRAIPTSEDPWCNPPSFWSRPWEIVCEDCAYKGSVYCGVQNCKGNKVGFNTKASFKQHLWAKAGTPGHPTKSQMEAWHKEASHPQRTFSPAKDVMSKEEEERRQAEQVAAMRESLLQGSQGFEEQEEEEPSFDEDDELSVESCYDVKRSEALTSEDEVAQVAVARPAIQRGLTLTPKTKEKVLDPKEVKPTPKLRADTFTMGSMSQFTQNLILQRVGELEQMEKALREMDDDDETRPVIVRRIKAHKEEIEQLKGERKEYRQVQTGKFSRRMEADKALGHGTRLAYLKEKSRKRAAAHRGAGSKERAIERVAREEEAEKLFNKPGAGKKRQVFPLSEGILAKELEAVPLSRREKRHGRTEDGEVPEFQERKWTLPPSAQKKTAASKAAKSRRQKAKRQRKKEESQKKSKKVEDEEEKPAGVVLTERKRRTADEEEAVSAPSSARSSGSGPRIDWSDRRASFGVFGAERRKSKAKRGEMNSAVVPKQKGYLGKPYPNGPEGWTRVDFIVDSGASDSAIPSGMLKDYALLPPRGYSSFSMADGREILNEGRREVQMAVQCGEVLTGSLTVTDVSKPLLSVGRMIEAGNEIVLNKVRPHIKFESGRSTRIFLRNGVYKLPVWIRPFAGPGADL